MRIHRHSPRSTDARRRRTKKFDLLSLSPWSTFWVRLCCDTYYSCIFLIFLLPHNVVCYNSSPANKNNNNRPPSPPSPSSKQTNYWARRDDIVGIWKLTCTQSFLPKFQVQLGSGSTSDNEEDDNVSEEQQQEEPAEIWLKFNQDGSFVPYGSSTTVEDEQGSTINNNDIRATETPSSATRAIFLGGLVGHLSGTWDFQEQPQLQNDNYDNSQILILATDRPKYANERKVHDTILLGNLQTQIKPSLVDNPILLLTEQEQQEDEQKQQQSNTNEKDEQMSNNNYDNPLSSLSQINNKTEENAQSNNHDRDIYLSIPNGTIEIGKFMYPKRHANFFDQPMLFQPTSMGTFRLEQILGKLTTSSNSDDTTITTTTATEQAKYHKHDFYGRKFMVTTMPVPPLVMEFGKQQQQQSYKKKQEEEREDYPSFDIRVMPIEFYRNNTFQAWGSSKILRGRFGITGTQRDKLWFQVSLFGAGRSSPGSVYSEGIGLTQEDRRGYVGKIEEAPVDSIPDQQDDDDDEDEDNGSGDSSVLQQQSDENSETKVFTINGEVSYGSDFAKARPDAIGLFSMKEITGGVEQQQEEEYDDDDDGFGSDDDEIEFQGEFQ